MFSAVLLPAANDDLRLAARYYERRQPGLGKRFLKQVRDKVDHIRENPAAYSIRYAEVRTALVDVFPFMIHFRIEESANRILIAAILHTRVDPARWDR